MYSFAREVFDQVLLALYVAIITEITCNDIYIYIIYANTHPFVDLFLCSFLPLTITESK